MKTAHKDTIVFETTVNNKNVRGNVTPDSSWFSNYNVYQLVDGEKEFLTTEAAPMQGVYSTYTMDSSKKIRKGSSGCGIMVYELKNNSPVYLQTINKSDSKIDESKLKFNLDKLMKDTYSDFETVSE